MLCCSVVAVVVIKYTRSEIGIRSNHHHGPLRVADQYLQQAGDHLRGRWVAGESLVRMLLVPCSPARQQTYGYCASIISSTIGQPGWYDYFNLPLSGPGYDNITTPTIATANGVFSAGGAVGTLFIMWSCEFFGRKVNIQLGGFFAMFGGALQAGANSIEYEN